MKIIILAAGQGTRLRPLTNDKPKCMVEYNNVTLIDRILKVIKECFIEDISIVNGYKKEVLINHLKNENITFYTNSDYESTNMVATLFCAKDYMDDDIIISYSDIIYKKDVLQKLINSNAPLSVVIDRKWKDLWKQRMDEPLNDAETLKIVDGNIKEIGKKPNSYEDIEGQYIGLIKISKDIIPTIINYYENLNKESSYDTKDYNNMYMTSFLQLIIDNLFDVSPIYIHGGWLEIDCIDDLKSNMV